MSYTWLLTVLLIHPCPCTPPLNTSSVHVSCAALPPPPPQVTDQQGFLKSGLSKLAEAEGTVDGLSKEADKQRVVLKQKQGEADEALVRIQASMMQVGAWAHAWGAHGHIGKCGWAHKAKQQAHWRPAGMRSHQLPALPAGC